MNIAKSAVLLASLLTAGSIFAQGSECGRHVRVPGEAIGALKTQMPESFLWRFVGRIDADVLDFCHEAQTSQIHI